MYRLSPIGSGLNFVSILYLPLFYFALLLTKRVDRYYVLKISLKRNVSQTYR